LLIVCEDDDVETIAFANSLKDSNIRISILSSDPKLTLGELRNHSVNAADGEYICQWDDDDWYHPRRLELQLQSAIEQDKAASILPRWLIYSHTEQKAYCSNARLWEGSLLCKKTVLQSGPGYPARSKGEDSAVIAWLYIQDQIAIEDRPDLYVYTHNDNNTWGQPHFQKILESSTLLSKEDTQHLQKLITI
jgi:glycosyltransferase involved in cell wall biosynthesis